MAAPSPSPPILPMPHRIEGTGSVTLRGSGHVCVRLDGTGKVTVQRGGVSSLSLHGTGERRFLPSGEAVFESARGTLWVSGTRIEVRLERARVSADVLGRFDVVLAGRGDVVPPFGSPHAWGRKGHALVLDGSALREAPLGHGGEAA
jgi:hypothetical protein